MVREAHQELKEGKLKGPPSIPAADFEAARRKQLESWTTTLGKPITSSNSEASQSIVFGSEGGSPKLTLRHLRVITRTTKQASPKAATVHRDNVTAASAYIREKSCIEKYCGSLVLTPGKFTSVSIP